MEPSSDSGGAKATADPFDKLLELENDFYREGYDAGVTDSEYAGMIEGKVFGIEKGYEKAVELGRLHGRALVWQQRLGKHDATTSEPLPGGESTVFQKNRMEISPEVITQNLSPLPKTSRLQRHIEAILALTDPETLPKDNSDVAVSELDDRIAKARARAKVVANLAGEAFNSSAASNKGIEDAIGLSARQ